MLPGVGNARLTLALGSRLQGSSRLAGRRLATCAHVHEHGSFTVRTRILVATLQLMRVAPPCAVALTHDFPLYTNNQ